MTRHTRFPVATPTPHRDMPTAIGVKLSAPHPVASAMFGDALITADASKVTPRQFLDAIFGDTDETRAARQAEQQRLLIDIIRNGGSLYGWPPMQVAAARRVIAAQDIADDDLALTYVERIALGRIAG